MNKVYKIFKTYIDVSEIKTISSEIIVSNWDYLIKINNQAINIYSKRDSANYWKYNEIYEKESNLSMRGFPIRSPNLSESEKELVEIYRREMIQIDNLIKKDIGVEVEKLINYWKAYVDQDSAEYVI